MRFVYVIFGVSALAALSVGWQFSAHRSADEVDAEPPIPSYALRHIRPGPLVPDVLTPTMVAPYDCDLAPGMPPTWELRSDRSVAEAYLAAVGPFPTWKGGDADPTAAAVHAELAEAFEGLRDRLERLQLVVTHYPRPDLRGRCFALVAAFHDLPDPHIAQDRKRYRRFLMRDGREPPMRGVLFEVRQVWQTEGGSPRLIEATVEVTDRLIAAGGRGLGSNMFSNAKVTAITCDITRGGHFGQYGRGARRGLIWCDRSQGIGPPEPWSAAYRVSPRRDLVVGLPDAVTEALRAFASRY